MMRLLRRRAISFLLVFLLAGSLFSLPVFAEGEDEALDSPIKSANDEVDESANDSSDLDSPIESANDDGDESANDSDDDEVVEALDDENLLVICTANELFAFAADVNDGTDYTGVTVRLGADIDLENRLWTSIGYTNGVGWLEEDGHIAFSGTFDGDGYTISGLNVTNDSYYNQEQRCGWPIGFFSYVQDAVIKNLTIEGSVVGTLTETNEPTAGAFVGVALDSAIINCVNYASVTTQRILGGIVGTSHVANAEATGIDHCINYGAIHCLDSMSARVGGIAGAAMKVTNSANFGTITTGNDNPTADIGGIIGAHVTPVGTIWKFYPVETTFLIVDRCFNAVDITASGYRLGGIVGSVPNADMSLTITNCYNLGNLYATSILAGGRSASVAGGILGSVNGSHTIENCYNTGTVTIKIWVARFEGQIVGSRDTRRDPQVVSNNYGRTDTIPPATDMALFTSIENLTAADLGDAYMQTDPDERPVLKWQNESKVCLVKFDMGTVTSLRDAENQEITLADSGEYFLSSGRYTYTADTINGQTEGTFNVINVDKTIHLMSNVKFNNLQGAAVSVKKGDDIRDDTGTEGIYALPNGAYTYEITYQGKIAESGAFTVAGVDLSIDVPLLEGRRGVTFDTEPADASVKVKDSNGKNVFAKAGETHIFALYNGEDYTYTVSAPYFASVTDAPFTTADAQDGVITVTPLERLQSSVTISVSPAEAYSIEVGVKNKDGQVVPPVTAGGRVYTLWQGLVYHYTVNATDAKTSEADFTPGSTTQTITVALEAVDGRYLPGWAGARPGFGIYILNRDGTTGTNIGNWNYSDSVNGGTYVEANGTDESSLITNFAEDTVRYPLGGIVYSGLDMYPAARLGVVTKGILAEDIIAYYNAHRSVNGTTYPELNSGSVSGFGVKVGNNSAASEDPYTSNDSLHKPTNVQGYTWVGAFDSVTGQKRYYYPNFLIGTNSGNDVLTKSLGTGTAVPSVLAITSYNSRINALTGVGGASNVLNNSGDLTAAIATLTSAADNSRALRAFEGMLPDRSTIPLGGDDSYYIGSVWIEPPYKDILTDVTGGAGTVNWVGPVDGPKAIAGETVKFTVSTQSAVESVTYSYLLSGGAIRTVTLTAAGGVYSFTMPDAGVTIGVKLTDKPVYTVTFNANGGSSVASRNIISGYEVGALDVPTRSGYRFDGWYTAKSGGTKITAATKVTKAVTYYAHWTGVWKVTLDARGGKAVSSKTVKRGSAVGALAPSSRTGYTFKGWYTKASGGTKVTAKTVPTKDVKYYAHWTAKQYKVTFNVNGGKIAKGEKKSITKNYNAKIGTLPKVTKTGYKFLGWYTAKSGGTKITASTKVTKKVTYYARWVKK